MRSALRWVQEFASSLILSVDPTSMAISPQAMPASLLFLTRLSGTGVGHRPTCGRTFPKGSFIMPSFSDSDRPSDESAEEIRRKERELAEAEAKVARRLRAANGLLLLRAVLAAGEAVTGNSACRSAGMAVQWAIDRLQDSE